MNFAENLRRLRKRDQITQEELADRLGVSRQSVSKWETGEAYPETDKLISLSDLFSVSIDVMMQGSVTDSEETENPDVGEETPAGAEIGVYARHMNRYMVGLSLGAFFLFFGIAVCVALVGFAQTFSDRYLVVIESLGASSVLLFFAASVFCFVYARLKHKRFIKENPVLNGGFGEENLKRFQKRFAVGISCLASAIFLNLVFLIVFTALVSSGVIAARNIGEAICYVAAAFFFVFASILGGLVCLLIQRVKYNVEGYNGRDGKEYPTPRQKQQGVICGVIMMIATALFLLFGAIGNWWNSAWVAFPVGGILCLIIITIMHAKGKNKK